MEKETIINILFIAGAMIFMFILCIKLINNEKKEEPRKSKGHYIIDTPRAYLVGDTLKFNRP